MVKAFEKFRQEHLKSFDNRTKRKIENLNYKCELMIDNVCSWYKVDDDDKITVISNHEVAESELLEKHISYHADISSKLYEIKTERDQLLKKTNKTSSKPLIRRDRKLLKFHLLNLENLITNKVNRILHNKRNTVLSDHSYI